MQTFSWLLNKQTRLLKSETEKKATETIFSSVPRLALLLELHRDVSDTIVHTTKAIVLTNQYFPDLDFRVAPFYEVLQYISVKPHGCQTHYTIMFTIQSFIVST